MVCCAYSESALRVALLRDLLRLFSRQVCRTGRRTSCGCATCRCFPNRFRCRRRRCRRGGTRRACPPGRSPCTGSQLPATPRAKSKQLKPVARMSRGNQSTVECSPAHRRWHRRRFVRHPLGQYTCRSTSSCPRRPPRLRCSADETRLSGRTKAIRKNQGYRERLSTPE